MGDGRDTPLLNDFWVYDPKEDSWSQTTDFPGYGRIYASSFVIGNDAYVGMGLYWEPVEERKFWKFNALTQNWTPVSDFEGEGQGYFCFSIGNKGYVNAGGSDNRGNTHASSFWEYDPTTDEWSKKAQYPMHGLSVAFSIGNEGYVFHGLSSLIHSYNATDDTWLEVKILDSYSYSTGTSTSTAGYLVGVNRDFHQFTPPQE